MITARDFGKALLWEANQKGITVGNLQLQKLAYYCQGYHVALYGNKLFDEQIMAYNLGPVVLSLYREYKGYRYIDSDKFKEGSELFNSLENKVKCIISFVLNCVGKLSPWDLVLKTHQESPWINHSLGYNRADGKEISTEELSVFFKKELVNLQDNYLVNILNAFDESEKKQAIEIPKDVLENDEDFMSWATSI